jgi:hypothetical protein
VPPSALDTGPPCNNGCAICPRSQSRAAPPTSDALGDGPLAGAGPLVVHGGEPTLHPELDALIARARAAGRAVVLDTNARAFAVEGRALGAARAGLGHAVVTLHGAREASHDFLTRVPGSFRQTVAGAMRLRAAGVKLVARILVSRPSVHELTALATTALGLGPVAVRFSWARMEPREDAAPFVRGGTFVHGEREEAIAVHPTPAGDAAGYDLAREWLVPRYALALEPLGAAVRVIQKVGRPVAVDGAPACLVPAGVATASSGPACYLPRAPSDAFAPACDGCALRERCPGVPTGYLARFGAGELVPASRSSAARET